MPDISSRCPKCKKLVAAGAARPQDIHVVIKPHLDQKGKICEGGGCLPK